MKAPTAVLVLALLCTEAAATLEGENEAKFFVKSYSTTTWTFLSSFTSTVPYTCFTTDDTAANNMACSGRRLRRARKLTVDQDASQSDLISSSQAEDSILSDAAPNQEKFLFTIWRTSSTTATITTFSTNRSVTVSASIMCTFPGLQFNLC
ncbi:uncharacterized protein [Panulirus ornatus]|uniref:uncharacterized protein isoform X2 n=1 Tax=Panulirus ornatus TaxID=150431 RepID=UPI003A853445